MSDPVTVRCPGCGRVVAKVLKGSGEVKCRCGEMVTWNINQRAVLVGRR